MGQVQAGRLTRTVWGLGSLTTVLVFGQAVLAGQRLAGVDVVDIHEMISHVLFGLSLVLAVVAVIAWRRGQLARWIGLVGAPGLFILMTAQAFAGYMRLFEVHVPLGAGLFGLALVVTVGAWPKR